LLAAALERLAGERRAYLDESCTEPGLPREVESLLAAHEQGESSFMERSEAGSSQELKSGTKLGPYEILARIGAGGMGEVYRARDTRLARIVAIKVLPAHLADRSDLRERFEREARTIASLNHPHVCTLHDVGRQGGTDYLVMEYLDGETLAQRLLKGPLPLDQALQYAIQIADALDKAHRKGVTHRDLKPGNIMLTKTGAKLLDFGLAKLKQEVAPGNLQLSQLLTEDGPLTAQGIVVGTLQYMAPEQLEGKDVDARTDIFAFGAVVFEMATGKRAFEGKGQANLIAKILETDPPPISSLQPMTPPALDRVAKKCLAKDPEKRWQAASDVCDELKWIAEVGSQTGVPAPGVTQAKTSWRWWIAGMAAVALVAGAAGWFALRPTALADDPLANAQFTRLTDFESTDAAISRDGKFVAFRSDRDGPMDTWVSQVGTGRFLNLTHGTRASIFIRNMGFTSDGLEIWLTGNPAGLRLSLIPATGGTPRAFLTEHAVNADWSPDGSKIAFHTYDPGDPLSVSDSTGANVQQIFALGPGGHNHFPTWSVDGKWIYFVSGMWDAREMDIWRIRPSGGTPERLTHRNTDIRYIVALDRRTLLYIAPDQVGSGRWLWALDTETKVSRRVSSGLDTYTSVAASADGHRLAVTASNPTANLWTLPLLDRQTDERDVKPLNLPTVRAFAPRFGGPSLFYLSSRSGGDGLWSYEGGQSTEIWKGADGALLEPTAVSFDGHRVAVILRKEGKRNLTTLAAEGGDIRPLAKTIDVSSAAGWSPDGKWIVVTGSDSNGPGLFKIPVESGEPVRLTRGPASNPVWSPDGSVIVYTGPTVGATGPLLMIHSDGTPAMVPSIQVLVGSERYRFIPGRQTLVYIPGADYSSQNFWMLDLAAMKARQLSTVDNRDTRTFDISPDGKQIVFDRLRDNSNIVLIDRPTKAE
jgi:Tol biopolymer transport system component